MKILAIDTSGMTASVAIVEDDVVIAEYNVNFKKTHSQTLLPMLEEMSKMTDFDKSSIDAIAVAAGPGSFTGLRIGAASVKGLSRALNKPIVAIPTVDGLAYNLYGSSSIVCPIMDARREQTYAGIYKFEPLGDKYIMKCLLKQCAVDIGVIIDRLNEMGCDAELGTPNEGSRAVVFLGDGVPVFKERIDKELRLAHSYAPAFMNRQRGAAIACLAKEYIEAGKTCSATDFSPIYLRLSQAEREQLEKENN